MLPDPRRGEQVYAQVICFGSVDISALGGTRRGMPMDAKALDRRKLLKRLGQVGGTVLLAAVLAKPKPASACEQCCCS